MRTLLIAAAAGIAMSALSGCQTGQISQSKLADACQKLETAHSAFVFSEIFLNYSPAVIASEKAIHDGVAAICADPDAVAPQSSVDKVTKAADAINGTKPDQ